MNLTESYVRQQFDKVYFWIEQVKQVNVVSKKVDISMLKKFSPIPVYGTGGIHLCVCSSVCLSICVSVHLCVCAAGTSDQSSFDCLTI